MEDQGYGEASTKMVGRWIRDLLIADDVESAMDLAEAVESEDIDAVLEGQTQNMENGEIGY
jgi:hypothetical protein